MPVQPTVSEIAWAAGLFEGEGSFNSYPRRNKQGVQIRLSMSDKDVVERFARIVGVGAVHLRIHASTETRDRSRYKPMYEWYVYEAAEISRVTELLMPWLGERRRARAEELRKVALGVQPHNGKKTHCPQGHPYEGENLWFEHRANGVIARVCRTCKNNKSRERMRTKLGVTPDRYRVKE